MLIEKEQKVIDTLLNTEDFKEIEVRVDDTDLMQVVHANKYLNYFDDGFISFITKLKKNAGELTRKGIVFPVRKVEIEYLNSATFGDTIIVHTRFLKIGNTSMTLTMDCYKGIKSKDKLCVKGIVIRLIMDMNTNKLIKVTEFFSDIV
ncbi:MAG: acyl-CoA thioesterase [Promethearchaeota archaeon]|nr:MAG: acyl-CoA thioesterase [Candidatus Lokiarchaeota archaeon]